MSELKRKYFYLKNDYDKINSDLSSQKNFNKQIQNSMNDITNGNDDYIKGLYQTIKNELDKILNEPLFHSYLGIVLEQKNNFNLNSRNNNYLNNGMKYLFEEILDKYILVNNCIVDDLKKQKTENNNYGVDSNNFDNKGQNMRELEITIDDLNNKLIQKDKIISTNKNEKKLLVNQINLLQRDIVNLRNKNINSKKIGENNRQLNFNYNDKYDMNIDNKYLSVPIFPHKVLVQNDANYNNNIDNINNIYAKPYIEENKYINQNDINNINYDVNNQNYDNNIIYQQYNDINNNNNENEYINNNEEYKDNQNEEEEEENEIYFEGQQFPPQAPSSDIINKNIENIQNNDNINNYENNNYQQEYNNYNMNEQIENDNENYNEGENKFEQEVEDYKNNQIQDIIEEEENENNTLDIESNKNKNSNINSIKNENVINLNNNKNYSNNNNNNIINYGNNQNMDFQQNNINLDNKENISEEEYIHDNQINENFPNNIVSQEQIKNNPNSKENNNQNNKNKK